jgi:hypothetical protein
MPSHHGGESDKRSKMDKMSKMSTFKKSATKGGEGGSPPPSNMISDKNMARLRELSKAHKGGMRSRHMRNMKKFMMEGDSFTKAHNKAMKMDKK